MVTLANSHNGRVATASSEPIKRHRSLFLAWSLTGIVLASGVAVVGVTAAYVQPQALSQISVPSIVVDNLDGPDVIVQAPDAAPVQLQPGQQHSWTAHLTYSKNPVHLVIRRADSGRILFQQAFQSGQRVNPVTLTVRVPGFVQQF